MLALSLEKVLSRVGSIDVLTAKEIFVHLSCACPYVQPPLITYQLEKEH